MMTERSNNFISDETNDEIDLLALLFTILRKYRPVLAAAAICAVLFAVVFGFQNLSGDSVSPEAQLAYEKAMVEYEAKQEQYEQTVLQYEQNVLNNDRLQTELASSIQSAQEHMESSLLHKLDPYHVWVAEAELFVSADSELSGQRVSALLAAYTSQLKDSAALSAVAEASGLSETDLSELILVETDPDSGILHLTVAGSDQTSVSAALDALWDCLGDTTASLSRSMGSHKLVKLAQRSALTSSPALRAKQAESSTALVALHEQLSQIQKTRAQLDSSFNTATKTWKDTPVPTLNTTAAASSTSAGSSGSFLGAVVKYGVLGFVLGALLAVGVFFVQFLTADKVYSARELQRVVGLPVLGALASKRSEEKVEAFLDRMEGRPSGSTDAETLCLMAEMVRSRAPEATRILVTGDLPNDQLDALAAALQATEALRGRTVTAAENILTSAPTYQRALCADGILLAVDCACSHYRSVRQQAEQISSLGKNILGCIVFE